MLDLSGRTMEGLVMWHRTGTGWSRLRTNQLEQGGPHLWNESRSRSMGALAVWSMTPVATLCRHREVSSTSD
ncbi:hypothetical protein PLICRDRAFT_185043 [Plicaturopsis crispa FD-325 SS-3]|nr:hypothetical protein PLICRDRAFT_185043 [Plicaturopsis crispa FD-325 SS-3]